MGVRPLLALILGLAVSLGAFVPSVQAGDMDITLARLRLPAIDPMDPMGPRRCAGEWCPDQDNWARLMSQLAGSMMPPVLSPARTVGYGGFYVGLEGWFVFLDSDEQYWQLGTEGDGAAAGESCTGSTGLGCNRFAGDFDMWMRATVRKGFPYGFELGTSFANRLGTRMWAWGLEVKWALLEGFRTGIGILPDVAVRGMVNTMTGDSEFNLTVPAVEVVISKPLVIGGTGVITPFISGGVAWVLADSELVDLTPNVNGFSNCLPDVGGGSICRGTGGEADYLNHAVFNQIRALRYRLAFGFQGRYDALTFTGSFGFDVKKPGEADDIPDDMVRQFQVAAGVGVTF